MGSWPSRALERARIWLEATPRWRLIGGLGVLVGVGVLVLKTAWLSDDAYITLRTVDNVISGYGLRWNVHERVQAYTHPLWFLLLVPLHAITRHAGVSALALSLLCLAGHLGLLSLRIARAPVGLGVAACALLSSRAFIDYSTSGLENPLTFALLALFVALWWPAPRARSEDEGSDEAPASRDRTAPLWALSCVVGLCMVNRMDTLLLLAPAMIWALQERGWTRRHILEAASGAALPAGWMLFSLSYYGFPFPNTAYAKIGTGIERWEVARQGLDYLRSGFQYDPVTMAVILGAATWAWVDRSARARALTLGALSYLAYVVWVGGDFMMGRFFAAPLVLAAYTLARQLEGGTARAWMAGPAILGLGLVSVYPNLVPAPEFAFDKERFYDEQGVADERKFYFQGTSLWRSDSIRSWPSHSWAQAGRRLREQEDRVVTHGNVGMRGYFAGPEVKLIDSLALTDPLLARLPAKYYTGWRVGHFARRIPPGYVETVRAGESALKEPRTAELYEHIARITQGPLWDGARWRSIWKANTGGLDELVPRATYKYAEAKRVRPARWARRREDGTTWNDGAVILNDWGACVVYDEPRTARTIDVSADANDAYTIHLWRGDEQLGTHHRAPVPDLGGLRSTSFRAPEGARREGIDRICVFPGVGDGSYSVGHVLLEE